MENYLFSEFDEVSKEDWLKKVEKDLKGKPIDSLNWQWEDIDYTPFFHKDDEAGDSDSIKIGNHWWINEDIYISDEKSANALALLALEGGASCISFYANDLNVVDIHELLKGIQLEWIFTQFHSKKEIQNTFTNGLSNLIEKNGYDPSKVNIAYNSDSNINNATNYQLFQASSSSLSSDTEILQRVKKDNKSNSLLIIKLSDHYYGNICRIRAIKRVLKDWNLSENVLIQAEINPSNETNDVNYRFIQSNAQALSAVIGGADILQVKSEKSDSFQNRINRNTSHLLELESYMARVGDPSAGSYFLEKMTQDIYEKISKEV